jgi:CBS domain-containing protein
VLSGVALGFTACRWVEQREVKPATLSSANEGSGLSDLLLNTTVEYLLGPNRSVVVIEYRDTIDHVLMVMEESNVSSVPVVDLEKRRYVGMLNVLDIVGFLSANYTTNWNAELANLSVAEVIKSNREPFLPLYTTSPVALLLHVMTSLANEVPIMGAEGQIINVVTRHDVLGFIKENIDSLGPRVDASVQSIMQLTSVVESVESDGKVADALKLMIKKGVSELAVVSTNEDERGGILVGNLCASDFRRLSVFNFSRVNEPVSKFISHDPSALVSVDSSASLFPAN